MTVIKRNSILAVVSEYVAKSMVYAVGYLTARKMQTAEFGGFTAALAFALVVMNVVDSGMGQIIAKQIAHAQVLDSKLLRQLFTWRYGVMLGACLFTLVAGRFLLPVNAYHAAIWLTPFCLLISLVDLSAWVLKGLQRIPAYCITLVGSRAILFALCLLALVVAPRIQSVLIAYGMAGILSALLALGFLTRRVGSLRISPLSGTFLHGFLPEVYRYAFILVASAMMVRVDLMLVAKLCGEAAAGLYGCAAFVIDALNLVPMATYGICLPAFAAARGRSENLASLFRAPFLWLLASSILLALWGPLLAGFFFHSFFGARYAESSVYFASLLWSCIPFYANTPLWAILLTQNDFKTLGASMGIGLTVEIAINVIFLPVYGPLAAVWSRIVSMSLVFLVCMRGVYRLRVIAWTDLVLKPGMAVATVALTSVLASHTQFPFLARLTGTGLALFFLFQPPLKKLVKLWNWLVYSLLLGHGIRGKATLLYMFLRWKFLSYAGWSFRPILPSPETIHIVFRGKELLINVADDNSFPYLFYEIFIGEDYRVSLGQSPECIIDAGAHYGLASLYFSCLYPDAIIHALEPCSNNFRHLQLNTQRFRNIRAYNLGLYSHTGTGRLYLHSGSGEHSLLAADSRYEEIKTMTLDEFMVSQHIEHVDILKIDVEGAEEAILTTAAGLERIDRIVGELHFEMCSWERIRQALVRWFEMRCSAGAPGCGVLTAVNRRIGGLAAPAVSRRAAILTEPISL